MLHWDRSKRSKGGAGGGRLPSAASTANVGGREGEGKEGEGRGVRGSAISA